MTAIPLFSRITSLTLNWNFMKSSDLHCKSGFLGVWIIILYMLLRSLPWLEEDLSEFKKDRCWVQKRWMLASFSSSPFLFYCLLIARFFWNILLMLNPIFFIWFLYFLDNLHLYSYCKGIEGEKTSSIGGSRLGPIYIYFLFIYWVGIKGSG